MKKIFLVLALLILAVSCRKEPLEMTNPNNRRCTTYLQQFEAIWQGMDQGYVFWDRDTVDWDARYDTFQPIFAAFDKRPSNNPVTWGEYAEAYYGLFEGLLDHHLSGRFYSAKGKFETYVSPNSYMPNNNRAKQLVALKKLAIEGTYYASEPVSYGELSIPGSYTCMLPGRDGHPEERIAYFRFTNFYMMQMYNYSSALPNGVTAQIPAKKFYGPRYNEGMTSEASYANNDSVIGIILDLRGNSGGSVADLEPMIGSLTQTPTRVGYTRVKEGFGRLDYSVWSEAIVGTPSLHLKEAKPIVVLSDHSSVSCAELATMLIKALPNGVFIGEPTFGAIGGLYSGNSSTVYHDLFYSGCFGDPDYFSNGPDYYGNVFSYYVYTSTFHMVDRDYNDVEGVGVQPDIYEPLFEADLESRKVDNQLNRAMRYIRTGR